MEKLVKNIFSMAVTLGVSDRDAFVNKVADVIKDYQDDPQKAEQWAQTAVDYLQQMRDNYRVQDNITQSIQNANLPEKKDVTELTNAIKELTEQLQKLKLNG